MKNSLLTLLALLLVITASAQNESATATVNTLPQNEVKVNALFLIAGAFNVTYERLLNEESGVGLEVFVPFDSEDSFNYYVSPYYRLYFGKKYAAGFFFEGFGMLNSSDYNEYSFNETNGDFLRAERKNETNFALGIGLGGKWTTSKGFIGELSLGVGRNLIDTDFNDEIVAKLGVSVGYRF